jgi:hypothetical protein
MAAPAAGVGYLLAGDILQDVAFSLVEPSVKTAFPAPVTAGVQTVPIFDLAMYVGAQVVAGLYGDPNLEVVTITAVVVGVSFTATFANAHAAGVAITGATFPVRQPTDPFFTQAEMLGYLSQAASDFLTDVPLAVVVATVVVPPTAQNAPLPADCINPVRVANNSYPLRETSQSNLDSINYKWQQQAPAPPQAYFRDKVGLGNLGVWPRQNATTNLECVYNQRAAQAMGLADGFNIPDPFLLYVTCRVLAMAYSKDGEQRNPALAKYWESRYQLGVKISNVFLGVVNDANAEMGQ